MGEYSCNCCCDNNNGKTTEYDETWTSFDSIDPSDVDPDYIGGGFGRGSFEIPENIGEFVSKSKKEAYLENWKKCRSSCGKN